MYGRQFYSRLKYRRATSNANGERRFPRRDHGSLAKRVDRMRRGGRVGAAEAIILYRIICPLHWIMPSWRQSLTCLYASPLLRLNLTTHTRRLIKGSHCYVTAMKLRVCRHECTRVTFRFTTSTISFFFFFYYEHIKLFIIINLRCFSYTDREHYNQQNLYPTGFITVR